MDDRTPVNEGSGEMKNSLKDNDDCDDAFQDKPKDSGRNHTALGNQVIPSIRIDASENQQLPSGISAETCSRPSVTTSASSSQALNIDQLDETISSRDVFHSSRKFRIRTKCSRSVDAVISNRQHLTDFQDKYEESGRNPTALGNQVIPSIRQDASENQQLPSAISVETCSRQFVPTSACSSQALNMDQLDEIISSRDVFHSSRDLRIRTNCSRRVDALLSPRQNPTDSSMPVLEYSDIGSAKINRRDRSPLGAGLNTGYLPPPQIPPVRVTRSLSKTRNRQETPTPSPEKRSVETGIAPTSTKRKRPLTSESDSGKSGTENESFTSTTYSNISTDASSASRNKHSRKRRKIYTCERIVSPKKEILRLKAKYESTDKGSSSNLEPTSNLQNSTTEDSERRIAEKTHAILSVLFEETQSALNMLHSATEIQMLKSSQCRPIIENPDLTSSSPKVLDSEIETRAFKTSPSSRIFSNPHLPLSCHLPEQNSSPDINVPHQVLELKTDDEKGGTDRNRSDSSTLISKPNVESRWESKKSSTSRSLEMLPPSVSDETLTSINLSEIQDHPEVLMQENRSDPLLQRQNSGSISRGVSTSSERPDVGMDLDPPHIDVYEGQPSTSRHQPVITDGSSFFDQFNSSGVPLSGETRGGAIKSSTSTERLSKYASNAQMLLLTVLEEMMKFNEEKDVFRKFNKQFLENSELSFFVTEMKLKGELMLYLIQRRAALVFENVCTSLEMTLEYQAKEAYEALIRIVVTTLASTVSVRSSLDFDTIMMNYRTLVKLYEKCSQFWRLANVEDIQDGDSRYRVAFLKEMIQRLLLQTRNAFRELLMHIGEHAVQEIIDMYENELLEEDKKFLRREI